MRYLLIPSFAMLAACSPHEQSNSSEPQRSAVGAAQAAVNAAEAGKEPPLQQMPSAEEAENLVADCMTEDTLREANATEGEIEQFRKHEFQANNDAGCG